MAISTTFNVQRVRFDNVQQLCLRLFRARMRNVAVEGRARAPYVSHTLANSGETQWSVRDACVKLRSVASGALRAQCEQVQWGGGSDAHTQLSMQVSLRARFLSSAHIQTAVGCTLCTRRPLVYVRAHSAALQSSLNFSEALDLQKKRPAHAPQKTARHFWCG